MILERQIKKKLQYYKQLRDKLEVIQTKVALNSLRNQFLQDQKRMNYQNEYERIRGELSRSNLHGLTTQKLRERKDVLERLGAKAF